jgi:hypothetical protein
LAAGNNGEAGTGIFIFIYFKLKEYIADATAAMRAYPLLSKQHPVRHDFKTYSFHCIYLQTLQQYQPGTAYLFTAYFIGHQ